MSEEKQETTRNQRKVKSGGRGKIEPRWRPGESGNPKGHPKGVPNRSTLVKSVLAMKAEPPEDILKSLEAMYPKFLQKKTKRWTTQFLMTVRIAQKALDEGDVRAFESLMNYAYGKETEKVDLTTKGKPLPPPILQNVYSDDRNKEDTETPKED